MDFQRMVNSPNTIIHFDLTSPNGEMINVSKAVQEVAKVGGNIHYAPRVTYWEHYQLSNNPSALSRTIFYYGKNVVSSPFR